MITERSDAAVCYANSDNEVAMDSPHELREKAKRYRRLALIVGDQQALEALHELAGHYDTMAMAMEREAPSRDATDS